ncbi:MAG: hypothetical protein ACAF41_13620 [Leptolyngbya sp. BL-A-14]
MIRLEEILRSLLMQEGEMLGKLLRAAAITVLLSLLMHEGGFMANQDQHFTSNKPVPQAALPLQRR